MKKKNNKKWTLVLVLLLVVSIGYAALASNLKINGTSGVKSATWDVYWDNVQVTQGSVEATQGNGARITDQAKTQVEYSVVLSEPGDFYEFTVDAVNNGTIDAMIAANGIVNGVYSDSNYTQAVTLPKAISYTVTYADGTTIEPKHLLAKKNGNTPTTETYKVRIEYRNDDSINPGDLNNTNDLTYYFKFSVNYVQADGNAMESHLVPRTLSIGDTVNYSTTLNGVTLDDWKVFYIDGDYTYLIKNTNLQMNAISNDLITTYSLSIGDDFLYCNLYNGIDSCYYLFLSTTSNWDDLVINGKINGISINQQVSDDVWAIGSPTIDIWVNSWNEKYQSDGLNSNYFINGNYIDFSEKVGYNDSLYFTSDSYGYYLASLGDGEVIAVDSSGEVGTLYSGIDTQSIRPIIKLPTSVLNQ